MIKLQNDFTTPKQSKRLLELGVPADSANKAYWINIADEISYIDIPENTTYTKFAASIKRVIGHNYFPAWSGCRLIQILMICNTYFAPKEFKIDPNSMEPSLINNIVSKIEELEGYDMLDFSKLED